MGGSRVAGGGNVEVPRVPLLSGTGFSLLVFMWSLLGGLIPTSYYSLNTDEATEAQHDLSKKTEQVEKENGPKSRFFWSNSPT